MLCQVPNHLAKLVYWVQINEIPTKSNAFCCNVVGRVTVSKQDLYLAKVHSTLFKQIIPKSSNKVLKLWTENPHHFFFFYLLTVPTHFEKL
jgi:hypothetical protein